MIDGAVTVICVPVELTDRLVEVAVIAEFAVSVKVTVVLLLPITPFARNPVPLMVTGVPPPAEPDVGVMLVTVGVTGE